MDDVKSYSSYFENDAAGNSANCGTSEPEVHDPLCDISQLQGMPASPLLIQELKRVRNKLEEQFDVQRNFNARIERQLNSYTLNWYSVYEPCQLTYVDE